jgi:hypothetical protein|tara:strand:+ start:262 stop:558 length:297 start_codon:yes stop_codon:yes gene_type:complete
MEAATSRPDPNTRRQRRINRKTLVRSNETTHTVQTASNKTPTPIPVNVSEAASCTAPNVCVGHTNTKRGPDIAAAIPKATPNRLNSRRRMTVIDSTIQ